MQKTDPQDKSDQNSLTSNEGKPRDTGSIPSSKYPRWPMIALFVLGFLIVACFIIWLFWARPDRYAGNNTPNQPQQEQPKPVTPASNNPPPPTEPVDETAGWKRVATQGKAFSMKIPDGWGITKYPDNYLGSTDVIYEKGTSAIVETSTTEYAGHLLRFRASIATVDDAGFGPQWSSPQPGLEEFTEVFAIDELQGKRYKAVFSGNLNQTVYEYIFDLGSGKKLDIVYTIHRSEGEKDDVRIVENAIKTILLAK